MRKGNLEIEIRFKVSDVKKLRAKLRKVGAKRIKHWKGYDIIFDMKNELRKKGRILRLRFRKQWGEKAKLTYKGRYQKHIFKIREELKVWIDSPRIFLAILKKLGFESVIQYEKRTDLWDYNGVELIIEKLPHLGYFMEIESTKKNIRKVAKILGFDIKEGIKKSYREYFEEIDKKKKEWFFDRRQ